MSAPAPSLADASDARQARLLALRQRRGAAGADAPVLRARNFDPETRTLRKRTDEGGDTVEGAVEGVVAAALAEDDARHAQDLDLLNIAPRRANWDLRREMERKTAKLERRTQEAVHALIRQRLMAQKGESDDLVGAMNAGGAAGTDDSDDSDEDDE